MSCSEKSVCWLFNDSKKKIERVFVGRVSHGLATIVSGRSKREIISTEHIRNLSEAREFFSLVSKTCG